MIQYCKTARERSDCTAPYNVILDREYTVAEFIVAVLKQNPREWGQFAIHNVDHAFGYPKCNYRYGSLSGCLPDDILKKKVVKVSAHGGWSAMDYMIWIEE